MVTSLLDFANLDRLYACFNRMEVVSSVLHCILKLACNEIFTLTGGWCSSFNLFVWLAIFIVFFSFWLHAWRA